MARKPTINPRNKTDFIDQWGISAHDLALVENTTTDAIHMRVMRFGTPFQRRSKQSHWERKYKKTQGEIAKELGIHPVTVELREKVYGTPWCDSVLNGQGGWNKGVKRIEGVWWDDPKYRRSFTHTYFTLEDALARLKKLKR